MKLSALTGDKSEVEMHRRVYYIYTDDYKIQLRCTYQKNIENKHCGSGNKDQLKRSKYL